MNKDKPLSRVDGEHVRQKRFRTLAEDAALEQSLGQYISAADARALTDTSEATLRAWTEIRQGGHEGPPLPR